ncbi:MAG: hypothetical protein Kow0037_00840 [Calditrichia bacterium]
MITVKKIKVPTGPKNWPNILNLQPLMQNIAGIMHHAVEENFEKQGRPPWPALAKSTIRQRKKRGTWPGKILQQSGQLAASVYQKATANTAVVGTNKQYAAAQQLGALIRRAPRSALYIHNRYKKGKNKGRFKKGTRSGRGFSYGTHTIRIPPRPFLQLSNSEIEQIEQTIGQYLKKL